MERDRSCWQGTASLQRIFLPRKFMLDAVIPTSFIPGDSLGFSKRLLTVGFAPSHTRTGVFLLLCLMPIRYKTQRDSLVCAFLSVLWISEQLLEDEPLSLAQKGLLPHKYFMSPPGCWSTEPEPGRGATGT